MFLKKLEIQGFKSFPEKIRLDFKQGITGVVGPNGSGKSNISDAIRWVLGEQNARSLRGDKMEDIIFAGTKNRKPLGFAEVTMHLDNSDKKLPLDYTDIAITRKVYRSGESGYFINGTSCRLKDIHELFMDTGIGKEGYSIIGQGKIDTILSNKSEDRRALFEEAVGIIKFKNRRVQAENKLQEVRKNLIRTNDIISELEMQIAPLFEQKEKAHKFLQLSENLKYVRVNLFVKEYENAKNNIKEILTNIATFDDTILSLENEKQKYIKNQQQLKENLLQQEQHLQKIQDDILNINIDIEQNQNNINLHNQNINFTKNDIDRIKLEIQKNDDLIKKNNDDINFVKISLEAQNLQYNLKTKELSDLTKQFETLSFDMDKNQQQFKDINNQIVEKMQIASELSNTLAIQKTSKENLKDKLNQLEQDIDLYNSKIKEKTTKQMVLNKSLLSIKDEESQISQNINILNLDFEKTKTNLHNIKSKLLEHNKNYIELKNKHKILEELEKDYEGYFNSVKSILKEKKINTKFDGICGVIGELVSVPKQYEIAIEIALGGAIQNIVTKTEEDAKIAINYLKQNKKGRATFLPITSIKPKEIGQDKDSLLKQQGVLGIANNIIQYDNMYKNIISSILGKTIIVDNIENGINLSKKYKYMYKVVTLDGELINAGGALTGGSISKKSGGIFSRGREMQNILTQIDLLKQKIDEINLIVQKEETSQQNIQQSIEQNRQKLNDITLKKFKIENDISQNNSYLNELQTSVSLNITEKQNITNKIEQDGKDTVILQKNIDDITKEIENLKNYMSKFEQKIQQEKETKDTSFNHINKLKIDIKDIQNKIENAQKDIQRFEQNIQNLNEQNKIFEQDIKLKTQEQQNLNENILNIQQNIQDLKTEYENLNNQIQSLKTKKDDLQNQIENITKNIYKIDKDILDTQFKKTKLDAKKENIEQKIESLTDNMWTDYEITYASACNDYEKINLSFEQLKNKETEYKKQISSLGNVNVSSIEQYKSVKERYDLNIQQREDILKADDDLKNIIEALVKEMEQQFFNQFELINKNFNKVFADIFGGGTAELILANKDNILTSGIEIVAQPPGKNLQNLMLLSGGERTLTAMSLLFAILIMKPSPFCVLDETEAALDDANVLRYANFLKRFSKQNQFILITHKTGTMEIADTLYGVTMEEQGVSKVISVELKDAKEYEKK